MVKKFLITRPKHDVITSYLYDFSRDTVKRLQKNKDIHMANLEGEKANRKNFEKCLKKEEPRLVNLNGHGDKRSVSGHKDKVILDINNVKLIKEKIIYALACDSLDLLGLHAVEKGALAYVGYKAPFMLVTDPSREGTPTKDHNALPFKKVCETLLNALVFGSTVGKAVEKTKEEYRDLIRSYGTSEDDPYGDVPLIRFALAWNLEFLDMCGDQKVSF